MSTLPNAQALYEAQEYDRALELLRPLAQEGDVEAQTMIGSIYDLGLGSFDRNEAEAIRWYTLASDRGYGLATNNLATIASATDRDRAKELYDLARLQGFEHAPTNYPDYM